MEITEESVTLKITRRKIKSLGRDTMKSAEAINLVYISDKQKGISRIRKGDTFKYYFDKNKISDPEVLIRIKSLVLPPAWEKVWICTSFDGHIQATGVDKNGRKQYRYHPLWNALRSETKFTQLYDFGLILNIMRKKINSDLALTGLPLQKVLATIVSVMQLTGIRVGNSNYEKLYGSYGLSTLKDKHVKITGQELKFSFMGKKGIHQNYTLKNKKLAKIINTCKEIPGKELFQYIDENRQRKIIDSGMVNDYIKEISGRHFTSKDFRTWAGSLSAIKAFLELDYGESSAETKRKINEALDITAEKLGNTRNICRKYYVHPVVIEHYTNKNIEIFIKQGINNYPGLNAEEQVLMNMLAGNNGAATLLPNN